jgi:hypothetical protein
MELSLLRTRLPTFEALTIFVDDDYLVLELDLGFLDELFRFFFAELALFFAEPFRFLALALLLLCFLELFFVDDLTCLIDLMLGGVWKSSWILTLCGDCVRFVLFIVNCACNLASRYFSTSSQVKFVAICCTFSENPSTSSVNSVPRSGPYNLSLSCCD